MHTYTSRYPSQTTIIVQIITAYIAASRIQWSKGLSGRISKEGAYQGGLAQHCQQPSSSPETRFKTQTTRNRGKPANFSFKSRQRIRNLEEEPQTYATAFAASTNALIFPRSCFPSTSTPLLTSTPTTLSPNSPSSAIASFTFSGPSPPASSTRKL